KSRITEMLRKPELGPAMVGVKVVSLDTGRVLFEENAAKILRPASNMKLYTVATALDRLSPDYRLVTSVLVFSRLSFFLWFPFIQERGVIHRAWSEVTYRFLVAGIPRAPHVSITAT